jgi:hypothetical protein
MVVIAHNKEIYQEMIHKCKQMRTKNVESLAPCRIFQMGHSLVALWKHFSTIRDRNQEQPRSSIIIFFVLVILVSEVS